MSQLPSIRLRPTETTFLNTQGFNSGSVFYDAMKNTLILMDGHTKGGHELLRADLSNITGGSSGVGNVNFGARTITAQAFVGNGSQLTNLPIPEGVATQLYVGTEITTAFSTPATTTSFGVVKVDGTTITINASGVISSTGGGGGGGGGVDLTAFSVGTPATASGTGALSYNSTTGVFTFTPPDLSSYLTSYTETSTLTDVLVRGSTTIQSVTINNTLTTDNIVSTTGTVDTLSSTTLTADTINTSNIINTGTGVPRWSSGSDFIIDAQGDVNVVGSKITNVATPVKSTDAANKAYVDGAASAFSGGIVTGAVNITNATASTSSITGALKVTGGVGIGGDIYAGGLIYSGGSPVLTSDSGGYNGGIVGGTVFVNNSTVSTSTVTGALRVLGGVGIQGALNVGPDATFNGVKFGRGSGSGLGSNTNVAISGAGSAGDFALAANGSGQNNIAIGQKTLSSTTSASNNVAIGFNAQGAKTAGDNNVAIGSNALTNGTSNSNTAIGAGAMATGGGETSTAVGHDALKQSTGAGNIGIGYLAGDSLLAGDYNVIIGSNNGSTITETSYNVLICDGAGNIKLQASGSAGDVRVTSVTASTSSTTGALTVAGGLGVAGAIYNTGAIQTSDVTASTSISTGSIVTAGGIGAAGDIYANAYFGNGAGLTGVVSNTWAGGTVTGASNFTNTTASTSTTTGAVRITGGLGVQGRVSAANFNGVTVPAGAAAPGANAFVRTEGTGYTYTGYINATHAAETLTLGSVIVSNATDSFYRRVTPANFKTAIGVSSIIGTPASNYGAVAIQGEKNGWSGISFRNTAGSLCGTLMMTTTAQGIYAAADNAWLLQWDQAGNFTATANVTAYSDERLKTNIQVIPNALDKVMQLDGVTFDRISNGERGTGLIAQQLQKVLPEAVLADKDGILSVAYGNTVGLLIEAMKEQQRQIEILRAEITALKGQ